jgi:hypothetical protein
MTTTTFDLHEDDWGMIALEPRENLAHRGRTMAESIAHGDAHRTPGGFYDALYVAPAPEVEVTVRRIPLDSISTLLGPAWRRYDRVTSGYSSYREDVPEAFAFHLAAYVEDLPDQSPTSVFYGTIENRVVTSLHVHRPFDAIVDELVRFGAAYQLILVDLWSHAVVDLGDAHAIGQYLGE